MSSALVPLRSDVGRRLDDVERVVREYVIVGAHEMTVIVLWVAHTYVLEAFDTTPYLYVSSAVKESGKTRLFEMLDVLVREPWLTGKVTASVLMRRIEIDCPTLLLDETDAAFPQGGSEYAEAMRGLLNTGYQRSGKAWVSVKSGGDWEPRGFSTFCPKAFAGIGNHLPETVASRSIPIRLKRRAPHEPLRRFRRRDVAQRASVLREAIEKTMTRFVDPLRNARPDIPAELGDRAADVWEPLLAIADIAGAQWAQRAGEAARALSARKPMPEDSDAISLLADIRDILNEEEAGHPSTGAQRRDGKWPSAHLVDRLVAGAPDSPWRSHRNGKPLDQTGLARMLRPFEIYPQTLRIGNTTPRGYNRDQFDDAFSRYLPPLDPRPQRRVARETLRQRVCPRVAHGPVGDDAVLPMPQRDVVGQEVERREVVVR